MTSCNFIKMHGSGNDFVLIDATQAPWEPNVQLIQRMADRRYGIGFDQLLLLGPAPESHAATTAHTEAETDAADFEYRIFNADGSEAEQCGNGARCVARYLQRYHPSPTAQWILTGKHGRTHVHVNPDDLQQVTVDMGIPRFEPQHIPFLAEHRAKYYSLDIMGETFEIGSVSMGTPHAILQVADLASTQVSHLGKLISTHPRFPQKTNVGFMQIKSPQQILLRVYERGAGETLACGSGACAAAAVAHAWGLVDNNLTVAQQGGELQIAWEGGQHHMSQTGPAAFVFSGRWDPC